MTTKELAMRMIEELPADATLEEIVGTLHHMRAEREREQHDDEEVDFPEGGVWDLLEHAAGTVDMPADWASEHDHYLYGTPKRSSTA
ncbi:MAG TPA: hypothetical protein VF584_15320 [Longimicrobium sp.]|jgi:hypothetical protein